MWRCRHPDHDDVTPREVIRSRLDVIGHVAAEGAIGGGRQNLWDRSGGDESALAVKSPVTGLHPAGPEIGLGHFVVQSGLDHRGSPSPLQPGLERGTALEHASGHVPDAVGDLPQLSAQVDRPPGHRVETDVKALERGTGAGGSTTDDDDVMMLFGRHAQLNDLVG